VTFAFTDEQESLRAAVRRFLEDACPEREVRRLMESTDGYDAALWGRTGDLGLHGLIVPTEYGGAGASYVDFVIVLEEMGRSLFCAPYFSTNAMAATLLLACPRDSATTRYLTQLARGEIRATVALVEASGGWTPNGVHLSASPRQAGVWRLNGRKTHVLDGHTADLILVAAQAEEGLTVFAVEAGAAGLRRSPVEVLDPTRKLAVIDFDDTPGLPLCAAGGGLDSLNRMLSLSAIALAAEQVGGAGRALDMAVEYAKVRFQFGRAIGSFQAIKHRCADLLVDIEAAKSAVYVAAKAAAEDSAELAGYASLAKAYCSEAYSRAATANIQIHGGIGFTWEHPAHLYYKRAKSSEFLLGDPDYHRDVFAQSIGL
jgi:alkylation response protein AidB-like acyl-CoA dehydrogenase